MEPAQAPSDPERTIRPAPSPADSPATGPRRSRTRPTAEFLLVLLLGVLMARAFAAEAYIVPTGSMAPTLLGMHRAILCPNCGARFAVGIDESGHQGRAVCANCGHSELDGAASTEGLGDRLLVQKFLYDYRPPRRWEVAVFQNPSDPSQAYVKRIVGLPGESVLLWGGDVYIDGRIARKTLDEVRAMRIPVYEHAYTPKDQARHPRWSFRRGDFRKPLETGWRPEGARFVHAATEGETQAVDWIDYRHWQADQGSYGPIRDFTPYNGADTPGENRVNDLMVSARWTLSRGMAALARIDSAGERFVVNVPADPAAPITARRNGRNVPLKARPDAAKERTKGEFRLEVAVVDRRLSIAVNGRLACEPFDFDDASLRPLPPIGQVGLGVTGGGSAEIADVRIDRDVYYTEALAQTPRRPFGVEVPYTLGAGEFFVLGDNSPVSNDSRFWLGSPVVPASALLGKPFLVHLPSQAVPLRVFGKSVYWVPDPREIRYIR